MNPRSDLEALSEGQVLDNVDLDRIEAAALNACGLVTAQPVDEGWRVTAAHAVGALRVGELTVRVRPKIGAVNALRLVARAHGIRRLRLDDSSVGFDADPDLHAVLAGMFADESRRAFAAGALRGYRSEDQTLPVLRGRVRLRDQFFRRHGVLVPIEVTVDEWTTDTDENRRIRAAIARLLRVAHVPAQTRAALIHVDRLLAGARLPFPGETVPGWKPTRLNTRFHELLHLTDLVLAQQVFEHRFGEIQARGFVIRMEQLFEDLVTRLLGELDDATKLKAQATYRLDDKGYLNIKPDLVFNRGKKTVAVADTKYKVLDEKGRIRNEDGYQLVTYCKRLGLDVGHLIYASGPERIEPVNIPAAGVRIDVHKIDITCDLPNIEQQVARLRRAILATQVALAGGQKVLVPLAETLGVGS